MNARTSPPAASGGGGGQGYDLEHAALDYVSKDDGKVSDADLRARITAHKMEARAFALTVRRAEEESKQGKGPSASDLRSSNTRRRKLIRNAPS